MPKSFWMVEIRTSLPFEKAPLILPLLSVPAIGTHRSRGSDRSADELVDGSKRRIMIVSERCPVTSWALPMAPASRSSGLAPARLSEPTMR